MTSLLRKHIEQHGPVIAIHNRTFQVSDLSDDEPDFMGAYFGTSRSQHFGMNSDKPKPNKHPDAECWFVAIGHSALHFAVLPNNQIISY